MEEIKLGKRLLQSGMILVYTFSAMFFYYLIFASYKDAFLLSSGTLLFILPSVLLFVLWRVFWLKYCFFVPTIIVTLIFLYGYFDIKRNERITGVGEGSEELVVLYSFGYGIGISFALGALTKQWRANRGHSSTTAPS
jgi:hypothetical protein